MEFCTSFVTLLVTRNRIETFHFRANCSKMSSLEQLEHLSLVQKITSEILNHTGLNESVLGKKRHSTYHQSFLLFIYHHIHLFISPFIHSNYYNPINFNNFQSINLLFIFIHFTSQS